MSTPDTGPPVILVVEDIDWIRAGMKRSLGREGFRVVVEAASGDEALAAIRHARPRLIVTDEEMPAFGSLLARVRALPADRRVPVVVVNPDADERTRYGDAVVLTDYAQLRTLLPGRRNGEPDN